MTGGYLKRFRQGIFLSGLLLLMASVSWAVPTVTYMEPQDGSVQPITATATAIFSEMMEPASITSGSFTLSRPSKITAVAAGYAQTVALRDDGTVVAWGANGTGATDVPAGLTEVKAIAAGHSHGVALKEDGTVVAWGNDANGQATVPADLVEVTAIAAGGHHTLALKGDGTVVAWGKNSEGQCNVPTGLSEVKAIAAGNWHSVALKEDGTVVAWGFNRYGQSDVPAGLTGVTAIAGGYEHTAAVKDDGTVVAWGYNSHGQSTVPATLYSVTDISAGVYHSMALRSNGTVVVWGDNSNGQSTVPSGTYGVTGISAGGFHSVVVKGDGTVSTWGDRFIQTEVPVGLSGIKSIESFTHTLALSWDGSFDAWGGDSSGLSTLPADLTGVMAFSAGKYHSLALKNDGTVVAWGSNGWGQASVPAGLSGVAAIDAGDSHSVALKQDGTVVAWGYDGYGISTVPEGLTGVTAIATGGGHTSALKDDGTVVAWGRNDYGQTDIPPGLTGVTAIAAGQTHVLALKDDGTVVAWGATQYGQGQTDVPAGLTGVTAIAAGWQHSVALKEDGTVVAWGYNNYGQCTVPVGLSEVEAIAAGEYNTFAIKKDGTVVGWGNDGGGQTTMPPNPYQSPIAGSVAFDEFTDTATFTPASPLTPNTSYQVTVNTGVQNLNGDHMANNTSWDFVTDSQKLTATVTIGDLDQIYDGATKPVAATTNPIGLKVDITYNGSTTAPTEAGTYSVVATINDKIYEGSATGTLIINKAAATINITDLVHTYDGSAKAATVTTVPAGLTVDITYSPDATPINAGSYDITATINEPNYQGSNTGQQLTINKALAMISLHDLVQAYDASPRVVTATTVPAGLTVDLLYDNIAAAPTNAGTYSVDATINESNYYGSLLDQTLLVNKATATINFTDLVHTYDGNAKAATVTTVPAGLAVDVTYSPDPAPTNAGTYDISALIVEQNYQGSDATQDLVINQATQSITNNCAATINKKDEIINLAACTSSTGNPVLQVTFVVTSGPGLLTGNDLTATDNKGQIVVTASKAGDPNYLPAADIQLTFDIVNN